MFLEEVRDAECEWDRAGHPQTAQTLLQIPRAQPQTREPEFQALCPGVCAL